MTGYVKDPNSDFFKTMYDRRNPSEEEPEEDEEEMEQIHETPSSTFSSKIK